MRLSDLKGKQTVMWGAGREASAILRAARRLELQLDIAVYDELGADGTQTYVEEVPVLTGEHGKAALDRADVIVLSPGVSRYRPEVEAQRQRGGLLISATNLWFAEGFDNVIGVTGTKGKSTTSSLIAAMLNATGHPAQLAGNIGRAPIDFVGDEHPEWWVLELSSFQTAGLDRSPNVGVLTTLSPEHLDWHGSYEKYRADKLNLFAHRADIAVVANVDDPGVNAIRDLLPNLVPAGSDAATSPDAVTVVDCFFTFRGEALFSTDCLRLMGKHNLRLTCLALTALAAAGIDLIANSTALASALFAFEPLPHRLAPVGTHEGVSYIDDGLATTPIATMAAIDAFEGRPITLLAGGHDRGVSYDELGAFLAERADHVRVVTMPANGKRIANAITAAPGGADIEIHKSQDLAEAVHIAQRVTPASGVVLLSPAAPSFGAFRDYVERSEAFVHAVASLGDTEL